MKQSRLAVGGGCDCFCLVVGPRARGRGSEEITDSNKAPSTHCQNMEMLLENIFPNIRDTGGDWAQGWIAVASPNPNFRSCGQILLVPRLLQDCALCLQFSAQYSAMLFLHPVALWTPGNPRLLREGGFITQKTRAGREDLRPRGPSDAWQCQMMPEESVKKITRGSFTYIQCLVFYCKFTQFHFIFSTLLFWGKFLSFSLAFVPFEVKVLDHLTSWKAKVWVRIKIGLGIIPIAQRAVCVFICCANNLVLQVSTVDSFALKWL